MKKKFKLNETVKVKNKIFTEEFNIDLSGRIGVITDIKPDTGEPLYTVEWDTQTLNEIELSTIKFLEKQQYDWEFTLLYENEIESKIARRCSLEDTSKTLKEIKTKI